MIVEAITKKFTTHQFKKRAKWLDRLTAMIEIGLIQDYDGLQNVVLKMEA